MFKQITPIVYPIPTKEAAKIYKFKLDCLIPRISKPPPAELVKIVIINFKLKEIF